MMLTVLVALAQPAAAPPVAQAPVQATDSISLAQLLDRVRTAHPQVGVSASRVEAARGARRAAGVFPNPVIGLGIENAALPGRGPLAGIDHEATATATVPLAFIYQRGPRVRRADAQLAAAQADEFTDRQRLALEAVRAFYDVALTQVELTTALDLSAWLDSLVSYSRSRVAEGAGAGADLLRAELERDRAWTDATIQQASLARAKATLGYYYGDSAGPAAASLTVAIPTLPWTPPAISSSASRPEVRSAGARLASAQAGVGIARSLIIPDFSAMVGLKRSLGATSLMAGIAIPLPIVSASRGELAQAKAERSAARFELLATEHQVRAEVGGATEAARLLHDRMVALVGRTDSTDLLPGYLARAEEARRIALGAYREGATPLLQVLDAARAWGEARFTYFRTLYAQHESVVMLLAAEGHDLFAAIGGIAAPGYGKGSW